MRLLDKEEPEKSIIFCRTKREVDRIVELLQAQGINVRGLHGDMDMRERMEVIKGFRGENIDLLVATDVAARGLNIENVSHVFNYHIPFDPESYVHRIGRTGRAGKKGTAITLVTPLEFKELERIRQKVGTKMEYGFVDEDGELTEDIAERFLERLHAQDLNEEAVKIYEILENEMSPQKVAYKLISLILDSKLISQKSKRIGFTQEEAERLMKISSITKKSKKSSNRKRRNNRSYGRNKK